MRQLALYPPWWSTEAQLHWLELRSTEAVERATFDAPTTQANQNQAVGHPLSVPHKPMQHSSMMDVVNEAEVDVDWVTVACGGLAQ